MLSLKLETLELLSSIKYIKRIETVLSITILTKHKQINTFFFSNKLFIL
jgi:hypothetical protein